VIPEQEKSVRWYLQGRFGTDDRIDRRRMQRFPFMIGRSPDCDLHLSGASVSSRHAEIVLIDGQLHIRDLDSTNGSFLNGVRLRNVPVSMKHGDVIHIVSEEIRVVRVEAPSPVFKTMPQHVITASLPFDWTSRSWRLAQILNGSLEVWFQPIVDWDSQVVAWEALGRGRVGDTVVTPDEMFLTARENDMELELCRALRAVALQEAVGLPKPRRLFLNVAPDDLEDRDKLLTELAAFREREVNVVIEIHERAVADPDFMQFFHDELTLIGCGLAFDDFGAGHSRLLELTQLKPDYLKFDNSFIQKIDQAPTMRQDLLGMLVRLVREYGITSVAEGIEREQEAAFCRTAGFALAQGHYFGVPVPLGEL
jgi:EAL domain-containing protein (putative c-di-GMP-specific phosphodiesterase class I)